MISVENKTGIYLAFPTSSVLKSIYRPKNYTTMVNDQHTKVGIAKDSFSSRSRGYLSNFDDEVDFQPLALIDDVEELIAAEKVVLANLRAEYLRVGRAREWFATNDHERVVEIVIAALERSGIQYQPVKC